MDERDKTIAEQAAQILALADALQKKSAECAALIAGAGTPSPDDPQQ